MCVTEREKGNWEVKANCQEKFEVFIINLQTETGAVPERRMKHFESMRHSSSYNCWGVEFAACGYFLYTPVVWRYLNQSWCFLLALSRNLILEVLDTWMISSCIWSCFIPRLGMPSVTQKFSPAIKLDFASQEKKERELDFLKNQHVGWPWSKL